MLTDFFYTLRAAKVPVSVREYLTLLEALQADVVGPRSESCSLDDFYYLSRTALVKDEKHFDKFDKAFAAYFKGVEMLTDFTQDVPLDWLRKTLEKELTPEQKAAIEKMGWDELMETLKKRLEEQKERHEGGNKWIGTGGTSPFGNGGYNPQGIRIGGKGGGSLPPERVVARLEMRGPIVEQFGHAPQRQQVHEFALVGHRHLVLLLPLDPAQHPRRPGIAGIAHALVGQGRHGHAPAIVHRAQQAILRDAHIGEAHRMEAVPADHRGYGAHFHAGRVHVDQQCRQAAVLALGGIGAAEQEAMLCQVGIAGPDRKSTRLNSSHT